MKFQGKSEKGQCRNVSGFPFMSLTNRNRLKLLHKRTGCGGCQGNRQGRGRGVVPITGEASSTGLDLPQEQWNWGAWVA